MSTQIENSYSNIYSKKMAQSAYAGLNRQISMGLDWITYQPTNCHNLIMQEGRYHDTLTGATLIKAWVWVGFHNQHVFVPDMRLNYLLVQDTLGVKHAVIQIRQGESVDPNAQSWTIAGLTFVAIKPKTANAAINADDPYALAKARFLALVQGKESDPKENLTITPRYFVAQSYWDMMREVVHDFQVNIKKWRILDSAKLEDQINLSMIARYSKDRVEMRELAALGNSLINEAQKPIDQPEKVETEKPTRKPRSK